MKEYLIHKLEPREDVVLQWYPRQWAQRELLVIWVWYDGCCDFAPTWGIVQIHSNEFSWGIVRMHSYEFSWNATSPMPISTNVNSAKESQLHARILANAHNFFFLVSILILSVYGYMLMSYNKFLSSMYRYWKPPPSNMHDLILIILLKFQW